MTTIITVQCNAPEYWANKNNVLGSGSPLYMIDDPSATNSNVKNWIPFTVNLRGNTVIEQAYITLRSRTNSTGGGGDITLACEAADNPSAPVSGADLNGRTLTTFTATGTVSGAFSADVEYTWQMDNPIQEILERPGWVYGNTLAVIIYEASIGDTTRTMYANADNPTYRAYLTLHVADTFIPLSGGII